MTDQPHPDESPDPTAWTQAALRRQAELLERLAEAGLELALAIKDQGVQAGAPADAAMPFSRVARTVRMTALLQSRLLKDMDEAKRRALLIHPVAEEEARLQAARERASADPAYDHKARVERIVERQVKARHRDDEDEVERLMIEAAERLDDDDIYGDVAARPVGELVSLICRDLGVEPDWDRLAGEAWAREEIESGAEGSPFLTPARPPQFAAANGGGGPAADPGRSPGEERLVVGASLTRHPHSLFP